MIQNGEGIPHKHHCLAKTNGSFTTNDCNSTKKFTCDGPGGKFFTSTIGYFEYLDLKYIY